MHKYIRDMESYLIDDLADGQDTTTDFDFLKLFAEDTHNEKLGSEIATVSVHYHDNPYDNADFARNTFNVSEKELDKLP